MAMRWIPGGLSIGIFVGFTIAASVKVLTLFKGSENREKVLRGLKTDFQNLKGSQNRFPKFKGV